MGFSGEKCQREGLCEDLLLDRSSAPSTDLFEKGLAEAVRKYFDDRVIVCSTRRFTKVDSPLLGPIGKTSRVVRRRHGLVFVHSPNKPLEDFLHEVIELNQEVVLLCSVESSNEIDTLLEFLDYRSWPYEYKKKRKKQTVPYLPVLVTEDNERLYLFREGEK